MVVVDDHCAARQCVVEDRLRLLGVRLGLGPASCAPLDVREQDKQYER